MHVGGRVRLRRTLLGMSQEKLGDQIGLTFQQVQKYERGANRIGSSRLFELSRVLDGPVSFFFDDAPEPAASANAAVPAAPGAGISDGGAESLYEQDTMTRQETLDLVRSYYEIDDTTVRKRIFDLTKAIAQTLQTTET